MVVFTCNNCGESLQKPKVEKHYLVCRTAKFLTCVDCLKDFRNEEYVAHTKCVTEEERYAAKGSHPQGVVKKGEVKQQSWLEVVQSVLENRANANFGQKKVFEIMSNATNVPRKKNKFINFVKSAIGNKVNMQDIEFVWDLIEKQKAQKEKVAETSNEKEPAETEKKLETENNSGDQNLTKKKKKKSKASKQNGMETVVTGADVNQAASNENKSDNIENGAEQDLSKKKKKKSKASEQNGEKATAEISEPEKRKSEEIDENHGSLKKNKKSKLSNDEKPESDVQLNGNVDTSKKKKKTKNVEEIIKGEGDAMEDSILKKSENNEEPIDNIGIETSKTKKRKSKSLNGNQVVENESPEKKKAKTNDSVLEGNCETNEETANKTLDDSEIASKFSFVDKILEILRATNNVSLKKLEKKVLNAYYEQTGAEPSEKAVKKFNKKLKKVNSIEISNNSVKLLGN